MYFVDREGNRVEVSTEIGPPRQTPGETDFSCGVRIVGLGEGRVLPIFGVDEAQALELAERFGQRYVGILAEQAGVELLND